MPVSSRAEKSNLTASGTMFSSVRARLTFWYAGVLTCTLLLLSLAIYWIVKRSVMARTDAGLVELADSFLATLDAELTDATPANDVAAAAKQSMLEHQYPGHSFAVLSGGRLLVSSEELPAAAREAGHTEPNPKISAETLESCVAPAKSPEDPFRSLRGRRGGVRCYIREFTAAQTSCQLVILASLHPESELFARLRTTLGWLVPFTILLASTGGYFLARKNLAPVADMTARADRISESTLHDRLTVQNPGDELGRLASTFNRLLDRLDLAFERQRRFIADASHELRTPLAILQGESEVALSNPSRSTDEYRESLTVLQHEARRLARIVEDMFTLSRADAGQYPVDRRPLYLDELIAECVHSVRTLAAAKSITVSVESSGELPLAGDESLLTRMLLNLLDNAIKYTPAGGKITITTSSTSGGAQITVADNGPGITQEFHSRIFERFFRADQARTRANSGGGAGLGLSIAKWIAEAHQGTLTLTRSDATGTVFTVNLPATISTASRPG
jgi:two-component system, OmpR family, sensor kinase